MMERAFTGFAQLAAPVGEEWWDILECRKDSSIEVVKLNFRRLAKDHHPDNGGSNEKMTKINQAYNQAIQETI
jgi:DnaJ-class molecular chaperone